MKEDVGPRADQLEREAKLEMKFPLSERITRGQELVPNWVWRKLWKGFDREKLDYVSGVVQGELSSGARKMQDVETTVP